ncbi:MAG: hypothetical protein U1F17_11115 [Burkholderiaceae bacterium]
MDQPLALAHGLAFQDLYSPDGLLRVDAAFVDALRAADAALAQRLEATWWRTAPASAAARHPARTTKRRC